MEFWGHIQQPRDKLLAIGESSKPPCCVAPVEDANGAALVDGGRVSGRVAVRIITHVIRHCASSPVCLDKSKP